MAVLKRIEIDTETVMHHGNEPTIYTVKEINKLMVRLVYENAAGREVDAGWVDKSMCLTPPKS